MNSPHAPDAVTVEHLPGGLTRSIRMRTVCTLRWTDSGGANSVTLKPGKQVLGSATGVDVVVKDPAVSRLHLEVDVREDGVWVRDLGSRNGTFIRGIRVLNAQWPLDAALQLGSTGVTLEPARAPQAMTLWPHETFGPLMGRSPVMRELFTILASVAASEATVLIQGETGTGKELVARAIHEASARAGQPFVTLDCASFNESLVETELFGSVAGAYTGSTRERMGPLEEANGGTVFLDEIGELPLALQPKLLRVLEARTVTRVGDGRVRPLDVRFLSATHRDLGSLVNAGAFREDLYFRLAVLPVHVPPLRERSEDIEPLVQHFLSASDAAPLSQETLEALKGRPWFGNIRELRNVVDRARTLGETSVLKDVTDPSQRSRQSSVSPALHLPAALKELSFKEARVAWNERLEREYLEQLLAAHGRNVAAAARTAGVDRTYLYRLMQRHGL